MRYEDSHTGAFQGSGPVANDDLDAVAAGSRSPATGNLITGEGTQTGSTGADSAAGAHITAIAGKGGEDTSVSGGKLSVSGEHGMLIVDVEGNYTYKANAGIENVRDRFTYTLADNQGATDTAFLIVEIGKTPVVIKADATQIVPGPNGVVTLPPGVELSDVHVVGRNLVVDMPDGTQLIIIDGAVFVPQLVLGGVEVPATNVAALLVGQEIQPAAGETPPSSGGNFEAPVPPLDPGVPLGDLIPPTEYNYVPPEPLPPENIIDRDPEAGAAFAVLDDDAQPGGNPLSNVGDDAGTNFASGNLPGSDGDGSLTWDLSATGTLPSGFSFVEQPNGDVWVLQGATHVLTVTVDPSNGDYTVTQVAAIDHPAGGDENNLIFVLNYTVTDADHDSATGTLTINVDDDTPSVSVQAGSDANVILTTDDVQTIGAASDTDVTSANFSGVFSGTSVVFGADGAGPGTSSTYALAVTSSNSGLTSHGAAINLFVVGGVVVGSTAASAGAIDAANTIFTVATTDTGVVTLTQFQQIDHAPENPSGSPFNDQFTSMVDGLVTLTRSETVIDGDGDQVTGSASVNIGANLRFTDDGPSIGLADRGEPQLVVDETDLTANATASFAANFSASFGADGPAAAGSITYALGINAGSTGLIDVATGSAIVLVQNGAVVEGHVGSAAGALAFTVSVDGSGNVTLDQIRALQHPNPANPDDSVTLANDNLVTLTATAHDFDGDTASSTLNIGTNLNFEDDGPSISASQESPSLTVDETDLGTNASADFSGVFSSSFGADGAGTVTYALGINAGATGLVDVATGQAIVLVDNAGVIEGHVGNAAGALAFTVSIDATGNVTLDQIRALQHPDPANPDDSVTLANDNLVTIIATITDKDGDQATATANIGQNLNFEDDGPSITLSGTEASLTVDETNLGANATAGFASAFTPLFGADGAGSVSYALSISAPGANSGLIDVATGSAIVLVDNAGVIEGHVGNAAGALAFTVSVDGSGNVTLDQIRALQHPNPANPDDSVTLSADNLVALTATVIDADGDQASATLNIGQNLNFEDDGPSISATGEQPSLTVDETTLAANASASFASVFNTSFGADGAGTIAYALGITGGDGVASGLIDVATGQSIVLVNNAGVIEGHVGNAAGALAFTVSVDGSSGVVTLDQIRALQHPNPANPDDSVTLANDNLVTITATITDKDGDQATATANIGQNLNFEDDGPTISLSGTQANLTVDETVLATNDTQAFASAFTSSFGADGAGTVTYALNVLSAGVNSGLVDVATGQAIVLVKNVSGVIEGHVGNAAGALAFTVSVDGSGNVTLDQIRALQHPNPANPDDSVTLSADNLISLTATVTDKDGDSQSATLDIGQNLNFEDDGPSAINDTDTIASGGNSATGNVITGIGTDGGVATADNAGADQPGQITAIQGTGGTDSTFSGGVLTIAGTYGSIEIDANGNYTYTRDAGSPGTVQDVFTYTLADADGDSTTATLTINISDAAPNPPSPVTVLLDDDTLSGGIADGPGDRTPDTQNTSGNLVASGGDGDLDYFIAASQSLPTGFTSSLNSVAGVQTLQISQNGVLVITVTLVNETGAYTVTQNAPIMHALDGNTEGEVPLANILSAINVNVFAQDADGDQSGNAIISISVDDDTPTVSASTTQPSLTVDETVLATNASADFSGVFTHAFGADGAAAANSVTYALGINAGATGLVDVATGQAIVLVNNAGVIEGHVGNAAGALAFTVSVNSSGTVTLDQIRALQHPNPANPDDSVSLANDNLITLTQTVTDKDGDQVSATANIGQNLNFEDDGPGAAIVTTGQHVSVDESVGTQVDSNDTINASVIALFSGVSNVGTDTDLPQYATNASAIVASTGSSYGADGAGTTAFSLNVSSAGVDSGLDTTDGQSILLYKEGNLIVGRVGGPGGAAALAIAIDPVTGQVSMVEYLSILHPNAANADDMVSIANGAVLAVVTVTDADGDPAAQSTAIGSLIQFQDSGPVLTSASNINIQNSGDVAHTGAFAFNLGADGANTSNDVITNVTGSATVGGVAVQNWTLTPGAENATTASYSFSFDYPIGGGNTAHETGTLVFDKAAGTYTVDLANPIQGVTTILQTAQGTLFQGYEFGSSTPDGSQPAISVTQIQDLAGTANDIYVQFTSVAEPSSGTGDDNLEVTNWVPGGDNPAPINGGGDTAWNAGQLFNQVDSWVSTSNSANGVAGDTIQGGEVLDFSLVQGANPTGNLAQPGTFAQASAMFLKFDGIGAGEDMIVVLKLYDPNTNTYTTRAIMVENADIQKGPGAGPGQYSGVTLDNNDGLVIIESNDYNLPGENWVIVGAQIAGSDEGITGTAINLNSAIGAAGDSVTGNAFDLDAAGFQSDTNDGPFKISSIGFLTTSTTPQNAQLDFNVTVTDGDGDSITQAITATVTPAADSSTPISLSPSVTTISQTPPDTKSMISTTSETQKTAANSNTLTLSAAVAASGLVETQAAASPDASNHHDVDAVASDVGHQVASVVADNAGEESRSALSNEVKEVADNVPPTASSGHSDHSAQSDHSLDHIPANAAAQSNDHPAANDQGPASSSVAAGPVAPSVGIPSVEALQAAGLTGHGGHAQHGSLVAQVVAEALGHGNAPVTVDALLNALPGANGHAAANANVASQAVEAVSAWDMSMHGAFGHAADMMMKMGAQMLHHDAVQPAHNG